MPTVAHFDVPTDGLPSAKKFYSELLRWNFIAPPGFLDFSLIGTSGPDGKPSTGGGMGERGSPDQKIMYTIRVPDGEEYVAMVIKPGGTATLPKMAVPGFGYPAICTDTEGKQLGIRQDTPGAA